MAHLVGNLVDYIGSEPPVLIATKAQDWGLFLQCFVAVGILVAISLGTLAINIGHTASQREERALKWIAALGPMIAMAALFVALRQWWLAQDTNEKTLRAYVMLEASRIEDLEVGKIPKVLLTIRNYGSTPAIQVRHTASITIVPSNTSPPPVELLTLFSKYSMAMAPKKDILSRVDTGFPLSGDLLESLKNGKNTLYVLGRVDYQDIYGTQRWTNYRLMIGGEVGISGNALAGTRLGDDMN